MSTSSSPRRARVRVSGGAVVVEQSPVEKKPRASRSKAALALRAKVAMLKANKNPDHWHKRANKQRSRDQKASFMKMFNAIDFEAFAEQGTDPIMIVLKYMGGNDARQALAPCDAVVNEHLALFFQYLSDALGYEVKMLWFKDSNRLGGGVHIHLLVCPPAKRIRSRLSFAEMVEIAWADASNQVEAFDREFQSGSCTWTQSSAAAPKFDTVEEAVGQFAWYEGNKDEDGVKGPKIEQKKTPREWLDTGQEKMAWAGVSPALEQKLHLDDELTCDCGVIDLYCFLQGISPAKREIMFFPSREVAGETTALDIARFSLDFLHRGATEFMKLTPEQIAEVEAIIAAHRSCGGADEVVAADNVPPVPSTPVTEKAVTETTTAVRETLTKDSPMSKINAELKTMFTADEVKAIEQRARESWEKDQLTPLTDAERIDLVAERVKSRFEPLVPHLVGVTPGDVASFAALPIMDQFESVAALESTALMIFLTGDAEDQAKAESFEYMHHASVHALLSSMSLSRRKAAAVPETDMDIILHELHVEDEVRFRGRVLDEASITWSITEVDDEVGSVVITASGLWV